MRKTEELIKRLKEENSLYGDILDFCGKIVEAQESALASLKVGPGEIIEVSKTLQFREGFPILEKKDFIVDIPSSVELFESICRIAKNATEKMRHIVQALEEAIAINAVGLREMLKRHYDNSYLAAVADDLDIDGGILRFLIHASVLPSLRAEGEKLRSHLDLKNWLKGYCPVCGSPPDMSELNPEGKRFFRCSFCGFDWPGERLKCAFCENRDHNKLHFFYEENHEAHRIDMCDECRLYIKTIDSRKLDYRPDLTLEDIATAHLDIIASEKGYRRPSPTLCGA